MDANTLQNTFFEHVKSGDFAEAEEVAAVLVEFFLFQRDLGRDVRDSLVSWQARQSLLQLMHSSSKPLAPRSNSQIPQRSERGHGPLPLSTFRHSYSLSA